MLAELIAAGLPWAALLLALAALARLLLGLSSARFEPRRLAALHTCQEGSVQSLSFVLTLPVLILVMMLIVQVGQLMVGGVLVQYAAFAAVRSAIVWIPADLGGQEGPNQISSYAPVASRYSRHGVTYRVAPEGPKYARIRQAAVLACLPLAPARQLEPRPAVDRATVAAVVAMHQALGSAGDAGFARRVANKLSYAAANTEVTVEFVHGAAPPGLEREPPLGRRYRLPPYLDEFAPNEVGWRDDIIVTVTHDLALLPGPARWLHRPRPITDRSGRVNAWRLSASALLGAEGEQPLRSFRQAER